ncbi:anthranilate phosphoribosyltransferase [Novosphingobium sp.]|uniref:anthranilate phosphoribosyltransferase n=1 Tax=Novosphingobium sp. TaxID=1874826 RepID=UPI003D09E02C
MTALPQVGAASLAEDEAEHAFGAILDGRFADEAIAQFLIALARRGETAAEIAGAARAMRARMIPITAPDGAIDVCGTGGDGFHTLNVSTAVSLVVAACGVPVAKHGNRAASSKAGAADTLEALGLNLDRAAETAEATLHDLGICFLFAAQHHPAIGRIMPIRRAIGERTIFNLMGPLANPAGVTRQLVGIARPAYVPIYGEALVRLGTTRAFVVSGDEGLDELSLAGGNEIADVAGDTLHMTRIAPADAGLPIAPTGAIGGGDAMHNAAALRRLLLGESGAYRDAVLFNAAAALMVAGEVTDWHAGVEEAAEAIDKGLANALLNCWIAVTDAK